MQLVAVRAETLAKAMLVVMGMHGVLLALMVILVFSGLATYVRAWGKRCMMAGDWTRC
ncbi:hypothetical protein HaLaN_14795 [Haematococcus lacustris]|uniref:Uncharacterized protein n=1 Tax=Haematococcus lacustris TaxID=44745 RepID=A0A699ZGX1_HAELA|nr:hypothetical protein HaLaN_14795 [Haematococcus lacustris]